MYISKYKNRFDEENEDFKCFKNYDKQKKCILHPERFNAKKKCKYFYQNEKKYFYPGHLKQQQDAQKQIFDV